LKVQAEIKQVTTDLPKAKGALNDATKAEEQRMAVELSKKEINAPVMEGSPPQKFMYPIQEEWFGPIPMPRNKSYD
jgi:hypothetical protein